MIDKTNPAADGPDPYDWQQTRRKPGGHFDCPIQGFGPRGGFTLWVSSPVTYRKIAIRDGKPVVEQGGAASDPELDAMRRRIIASVQLGPMGAMSVDMEFMAYAIALLNRNYTLSDEDMTFMLTQGRAWHEGVLNHLCGGEAFMRAVVRMHVPEPMQAVVDPLPVTVPQAVMPRRESRLTRLLRGFRRARA